MLVLIALLVVSAAISVVWLKAAGVKIAILMAVFLWLVLKALWVRLAPPEGTEITARDAPELFGMIEELRRALRSPRFHHVLVTDDFNAAVVQAPRLGLFGWYRNYLLIGLPLAKALTVEQFKAVLAHEFGHLSKGHGRMSNWIYRQRLRWSRLMAALEAAESWGVVLFRPFLRWYAPYFNAYSYPLARANEFEVDATSARLVAGTRQKKRHHTDRLCDRYRARGGHDTARCHRESLSATLSPDYMTTAAAMMAGVPLTLGHGTGSELRQPLGYAMVGGLPLSQLLTLTLRRSFTCTSIAFRLG